MARKKKHEEHENHERWLVSYADFITLLFAFFTVLYALGQTDKSKYLQALEAIQKSFLSGGGIFPVKGSPFTPFDKPPDQGSLTPTSPEDTGSFAKSGSDTEEAANTKAAVQNEIASLAGPKGNGLVNPKDLQTSSDPQGVRVRLSEKVLFSEGSDKLKKEQVPLLFELGKRLTKLGFAIQIQGHTDESKKERSSSAWELSISRTLNIARFLVDGTGFPSEKITLAGFGGAKPIAPNSHPMGRSQNRRVEILVFTEKAETP